LAALSVSTLVRQMALFVSREVGLEIVIVKWELMMYIS
jgi:hypothetical protein